MQNKHRYEWGIYYLSSVWHKGFRWRQVAAAALSGSEVLTGLSGLGRSSEEAAGAHMVDKQSIESIKDHETMESSTPGTHCAWENMGVKWTKHAHKSNTEGAQLEILYMNPYASNSLQNEAWILTLCTWWLIQPSTTNKSSSASLSSYRCKQNKNVRQANQQMDKRF
jgi:hypothetical protein